MKLVRSASFFVLILPAVSAFVPANKSSRLGKVVHGRSLELSAAIITGPQGRAAASREEDIALTLQIIRDHDARSTTVTKEQFIQQMEAASEISADEEEVEIDVSVPYDAASKLAYEASDKSMAYEDFQQQYLIDAVALVKSKQGGSATKDDSPAASPPPKIETPPEAVVEEEFDVSVPYDAASKLAYEASDKSMAYDDFRQQYLMDAVALVKSKQDGTSATKEDDSPAASPPPKIETPPEASSDTPVIYKGTVKWFDSKKGFGFLTRTEDDVDIFVHQSAIHAEGFRSLKDGADVEFQVETAENGKMNAVHVTGPDGKDLPRGYAYKKRD